MIWAEISARENKHIILKKTFEAKNWLFENPSV